MLLPNEHCKSLFGYNGDQDDGQDFGGGDGGISTSTFNA